MKTKKAFTLIELLVVISIISLLIGILLPALGAARKTASKLSCMSQMRQIGTANQIFAVDHDDFLVKHWENRGPLDADPSGYGGDASWGYEFPFQSWDYILSQVVSNKSIFKCPDEDGEVMYSSWVGDWAGPNFADAHIHASYRLNMGHHADTRKGMRVSDFKNPSSSMVIAEGLNAEDPERYLAQWVSDMKSRVGELVVDNTAFNRHGGGTTESIKDGISNYVFVDGHAESMAWGVSWDRLGGTDSKPETIWRMEYEDSRYNNGQPLTNQN
ncbi:hypothetical protein KS4_15580 [Poriferisphaera corsica]|uniref:Prepilin-type N-terminal cleavage/methylation domain-containing protein n=1 Tax=Poriferisphaera corsica TaxID=2528020 RepID=A0A517YTF5_9BACT|nr:prepilin-type N-terminal cleavage/methylation domain-containing protein [Poriferisphaera corsica]QDU33508.1 hypothetical protein KS4_15580 [Poriferisphaera corsica]